MRIMDWLYRAFNSSIGKKSYMAVSGLLLSFFIFSHLLGNAMAFWGRSAFNGYAARLHSMGGLITLIEVFLLFLFLSHITTGLLLFFENRRARPARYAVDAAAGGRNLASKTMPYTGLALLAFLVIHLDNFHFTTEPTNPADIILTVLGQPGYAFFYIFATACLVLHISHGFWSLFQSLGLSHPKYDPLVRGSALVLSSLAGSIFGLIPLLALLLADFLR